MRRRSGYLRGCLFVALAGAACAQLRGPVMGYLPEGGALRAMQGIPAAGSVGEPLAANPTLSRIEVSPDQTHALGIAADNGGVMWFTIGGASAVAVDGASASPDKIVFSPSGSSVLLWYSASLHMQIVSGLLTTPAVRSVDASFAGSAPSSLAVSDDGQWVAAAWGNGVYSLGPDGAPAVLPVTGPAEAVCFFHGRADVAVITPRQVVLITNLAATVAAKVIWIKPDDPPAADPATAPPVEVAIGFATSFDNRYLSIAGNLGALATFDLAAGTSIGGDCSCTPLGLYPMGENLFRLNGVTDGAVKIFDAASNEVWFVPAAPPPTTVATAGGQQ